MNRLEDIARGYKNLIAPLTLAEVRTMVHSRLINLRDRMQFEASCKNRTDAEMRALAAIKLAEYARTHADEVIAVSDEDLSIDVALDELQAEVIGMVNNGPSLPPTRVFRLASTQNRIAIVMPADDDDAVETPRIIQKPVVPVVSVPTDVYRHDLVRTIPRLKRGSSFPGAYSHVGPRIETVAVSSLNIIRR